MLDPLIYSAVTITLLALSGVIINAYLVYKEYKNIYGRKEWLQ